MSSSISQQIFKDLMKNDEDMKKEVEKTQKFIQGEYLNYFEILFNEVCGKTRKNKLELKIGSFLKNFKP
jgi:hypothetical protein